MSFPAMKRRNFLSGLLAAPLALKARFLALFACSPVAQCDAPIMAQSAPRYILMQSLATGSLTRRQREVVELLAEGKSLKEAGGRTVDCHTARNPLLYCSLPSGHKGPHVWLNPCS